MIFLQEVAALIKQKEEREMVYSEICWMDLNKRLINILPSTKITVVGVEKQKDYKASNINKGIRFDYYEVLGVRDGYVTYLKLYTTHQP